jgi:hypothetical protein
VRIKTLEDFSLEKNTIEYYPNISNLQIESFDYIFINFVLVHITELQARRELVQNIRRYKKRI